MEVLPGPVTNSRRRTPERASSSTTYCTTGLRPTGSISLGWLLVEGSRRVPWPATGTMARSIGIKQAYQVRCIKRSADAPSLEGASALRLTHPTTTTTTQTYNKLSLVPQRRDRVDAHGPACGVVRRQRR